MVIVFINSFYCWYFITITGMGLANIYITTSDILAKYFDKHKYLAFSVAILGQFSGRIAWPVVSQNLLDNYGYSHAMAIMGSFHFVHIIAGIFFIEPPAFSQQTHSSTKGSNTYFLLKYNCLDAFTVFLCYSLFACLLVSAVRFCSLFSGPQ